MRSARRRGEDAIEGVAVFAGRPWEANQLSPMTRLVGHFASIEDALRAFSHVDFVQLPPRRGRVRWRGAAPFGAAIVQIERRLVLRRAAKRKPGPAV